MPRQRCVRPYNHVLRLGIDTDHIVRVSQRYADALTLTNRKPFDAVVSATTFPSVVTMFPEES